MAIKNIVFDFGGVLLDLDPSKTFEGLVALMGNQNVSAKELYHKHKSLFDGYEKGEIIMENFLWHLQSMCIEVPDAPILLQAWNAMLLGWNPNKLSFLEEVKNKYQIFLLSNTNEIHINWVRRDLKRNHNIVDFEKRFFTKAYYSYEMKMRKPDTEIFNFVISDSKLDPQETLLIDDNAENIEAARQCGWNVYLLKTNSEIDLEKIIQGLS
jgi:glucose-1-phosphatase